MVKKGKKIKLLYRQIINDKKSSIPSQSNEKNKKKNYDFQFQKVFLITFFEGNGRYEAEENNSNGIVCDDDAHKVVFSARSPFFFTRGSY